MESLQTSIVRLAREKKAWRPVLLPLLRTASLPIFQNRQEVNDYLEKEHDWTSWWDRRDKGSIRPEPADFDLAQKIIDKCTSYGGELDRDKCASLMWTLAKRTKKIKAAIRRGSAVKVIANRKFKGTEDGKFLHRNVAQLLFERAVDLAGGPNIRPKPVVQKIEEPPLPAPPLPNLPSSADAWEIYSSEPGSARAAKALTKVLTSALQMIGRNVRLRQTPAARKKAIMKAVAKMVKSFQTYSDFGTGDSEPRYTAKFYMQKYLTTILGDLTFDYPEVESALEHIYW